MVDYNKLFDVLYSDTIPMTVKESIVENVKEQISEDIFEAEENPYINILNNLVYSEMSESTTNELIDKIFGNLSENEIEAITNKFIKESCVRVVSSGEIPIMEGSTDYVGLSKMDRDERKSHIHGIDRTKKSPLDKLKGVVDKVKTAAKNSLPGYIMQDRPTGLSQIKGLDRIRANKPNTAEAPKAETKREAPKAEAKYWRGQNKGVPDPDKPIYAGTSKKETGTSKKETGTSVVPVKSGVPAAAKAKQEAPKAEAKQEGTKALTAQPVHLLPDLQKGKEATRKEKVEQLKLNVGNKDKKVKTAAKKVPAKSEEVKTEEVKPAEVKAEKPAKKKVKKAEVDKAIAQAEKTTPKKVAETVKAPKVEAKTENKEAEAPKETTARSDGKFKERVDALRKKMGVNDIKLDPDLVNKLGDKKNKPAKEKVEDVKPAEAPKAEAKVETTPIKTAKAQTPKAGGNKEEKIQSPLKNLHNKIQAAADKKQAQGNSEVKKEPAQEVSKKPEKKEPVTETPRAEENKKAPEAETNKTKVNNIQKVDQKVQTNAETSKKKEGSSDEDREAKLARIRFKRQLKDEASGITKAIESLKSQLDDLKSKPGSSASDIQSLEQRIKDAERTKADKEKALAAYESYSNSTLSSLLTSNISESAMEEILEMVCSKALAQKAAERERKQADDSMNNLNKVIEVEAETGKSPVTPEVKQKLVDKANKDAEKYESVKASVERKYGK